MFYKKLSKFLIGTLLVFFVQNSFAQKETVINNKGTKIDVNNNRVFNQATDPNPTLPTPPITVQNDIWFDTSTTPNTIKIWDGTAWKNLVSSHTGTTGSVFFAGADGTPTENNSHFFWDNTNDRLRIGNPLSGTNKVTVQGTVRSQGYNNSNGTAGLPAYRFSSDADVGMYRIGTNQLGFSTNGTNALSIDATQNVSIGANLSVTGTYNDSSGDAGTAGQVLSSTATGTNWVDPNLATVENKTGNYTLTAADNGKVFTFNSFSTADVILTVPNGLPVGFNISIYQTGAGRVLVQGVAGVTILNRLSRFKTAGKDAGAGLVSTSTNTFHLTGDLRK